MSSAMELRAEMVDRQRSGSEADEMRDRKRRQSTAYQHDAMRELGNQRKSQRRSQRDSQRVNGP